MSNQRDPIEESLQQEYKYGFVTEVEQEIIPKGLNEDVVRLISAKKNEPAWLLEWRLKAYAHWKTLKEPSWQHFKYDTIDYQERWGFGTFMVPGPGLEPGRGYAPGDFKAPSSGQ